MYNFNLIVLIFVVILFEVLRTELAHWFFSTPPNEPLRVALSDSSVNEAFPTKQSNLTQVARLVTILNATRHNGQRHSMLYVDMLFVLNYICAHLLPSVDLVFVLNIFCQSFGDGPLVYTSNEYYLNVMAGALYGRWMGLTLCWSLAILSSVISYCTVRFVTWLVIDYRDHNDQQVQHEAIDPLGTAVALAQELPNFVDDLDLIQNDNNDQEDDDDDLFDERTVHHPPQTAEDLIESIEQLLLRVRQFRSHRIFVLLTTFRLIPFVPNWLQNIVATLNDTSLLQLARSIALGYIPYVCYCVDKGVNLMHNEGNNYNSDTFKPMLLCTGMAVAIQVTLLSVDFHLWNRVRRWIVRTRIDPNLVL